MKIPSGPVLPVVLVASLAVAVAAACGPAAPSATPAGTTPSARPSALPPATTVTPLGSAAAPAAEFDPCSDSKPMPKSFEGILKTARCEQDLYLKMADVAGQLGVECNHCHQVDPANPKKEVYPPMTPKKEIANWMNMHLMRAVKPADGSPLKCKSCHTDDSGKPVAKILGNPRDPVKAHEWMSLVMVNKFVVAQTGERLKCKSCHGGNFSTPQWKAKVILQTAQIPPH